MYSHAEGAGSLSGGISSHAEGNGTVTNNLAEHAEGSYNKSNTNSILFGSGGNTLHSIGIGTSMADSKNAFEVMQNGDAYLIGIGGYDGTNPEQTSTVQEALATKSDIPTIVEQTAPTAIILADNTEYYLMNISDLSITYPSGRFESWISLTTATSGTVTIELPTSRYIGTAPTFGNGETWEIRIKNGVVAAAKVGDGT